MTLSTNIYVHSPIDGEDLFFWVNKNLLGTETPRFEKFVPGDDKYPGKGWNEKAAYFEWNNQPGQGLDAWFMLKSSPEPMTSFGPFDTDDEDDAERHARLRAAIGVFYADLNFDTAYGYKKNGLGCTELHVTYIVRLYREYFEPRGIDITWQDEYTGEFYKNLDPEGFKAFLGGGDDAMGWFTNIAKPAIEKMVAKEMFRE